MKRKLRLNIFTSVLLTALVIVSSVLISANAAEKIKLKKKLELPVKASKVLKLSGADSKKVKWTSSDKKIASVSKTGKVKAKSLGTAVITARYKKKDYSCKVTVKSMLIAHRGFSSEYPENTLVAFEEALYKGFDGIECDVWETKNGDLLVNHDPTIERMTGKKKYIWNLTNKTRKKYPFYYKDENGKKRKTYIPTFAEAAETVYAYDGYLLLHIKTKASKGNTLSDKGIKKIIKILDYYELTKRTIIFESGTANIRRFKNYGIKLGVNYSPKDKSGFKKYIKWCDKNSVRNLVIGSMKKLRNIAGEKAVFNYARKFNVDIGIYTVNKKSDFKELSLNGAVFGMSDYYLL